MAPHRWIIVALTLSLLVLPLAATAQKPVKLPSIGVLEPEYPPTVTPQSCSVLFRQALDDLGYREGQNVILEYRYAERLSGNMTWQKSRFVR